MKTLLIPFLFCLLPVCTVDAQQSAPRSDLYACDGCAAALAADPDTLSAQMQIAGEDELGERLLLTGTVYQSDGATPAADVVLYMHQTHAGGRYEGGDPSNVWARRHGRLRGWVKTGADGRYGFGTIKPGIYPGGSTPAHLHLVIVEPGRPPYYIDDVVFSGEALVTPDYLRSQPGRSGRGVVTLVSDASGRQIAVRDIVLERHPHDGRR